MSESRKIYLATSGEYSDYRVQHVFSRREDAEAYELGDGVEERELQEGPVEVRVWHMLFWDARIGDRKGDSLRQANPYEYSQRRDFDGRPGHTEHRWHGDHDARYPERAGTSANGPRLQVSGWDLDRVRKVYSEQRAQYEARAADIA